MAKEILTVDDSNMITFLWKMVLEQEGYVVTQVKDGETALTLLNAGNHYDCIIVDQHMDGMNGLELAGQIRAMPTRRLVPIIMITADRAEQLREDGRKIGINARLIKPVNPRDLLDIVNRLCPTTFRANKE